MSILICEIGNILASNAGLTANVTSDRTKSYPNIPIQVMEKAELYGKLGIQCDNSCPDITILSNLEQTFNFSDITASNILPIIKLHPDLFIGDYTNNINRDSVNYNKLTSIHDMFDRSIVSSWYTSTSSTLSGTTISCLGFTNVPKLYRGHNLSTNLLNININGVHNKVNNIYNFDENEMKKAIITLKETAVMASYKLLCKLIKKRSKKSNSVNQLQFKIMDMFGLPNQQQLIEDQRVEIENLKAQLKEYEKSKNEIAELSARLNRLLG